MERKFKTTAKCAGCVKAIGEKLSKELAPSDARIEELVREAGFKIEKL